MSKAIICGAGAAGLASAAMLKRAGIEPTVLERADQVGASWRKRYPALRLNTVGWMSSLPGYRAKKRRYGEFPTRDAWVQYLEDYARHHGLEPRFGVEVERIDRSNGAWRVRTSAGAMEAPIVVVAIGFDHDPHLPEWPGRGEFKGELIHSSEYVDPEPYRDRDVLVVGANISGTEIAAFLADGGAARVRLAMRTPPHVFPRKWLGSPLNFSAVLLDHLPERPADAIGRLSQRVIFGDLEKYGLPFPEKGIQTSIRTDFKGASVDAGFVKALKEGRIEIVRCPERFEGRDVVLADGERIQPDAVICATGYRRGLGPVVGHLGVLDERGMPRGWPTVEVDSARNLFFTGYVGRLSGQLRQFRFEARKIAKTAKRRLEEEAPTGAPALSAS